MKVRLSANLRQKIETAARDNNRTMNAEIVARLEQSFREEGRAVSPLQSPDLERLARLERFSVVLDERMDRTAARLSALEKRIK
jgi:hypothetical protein